MPGEILQTDARSSGSKGGSTANLHERVRLDLERSFAGSPDFALDGGTAADLVIRRGERVAVVEIKTGDPDLPLPSSTASQMRLLAGQARQKFSSDVKDVVTVLVTNYKLTEDDEKELGDYGIHCVAIAPVASRYDPQSLSHKFAEVVGL